MMDSEDAPQVRENSVALERCTCGEELRYAEELQTNHGTVRNVVYCPNPAAHGGEVKFQKRD